MTKTLELLLIAHILLGLFGVMAFCGAWMNILKKTPSLKFLKWSSVVGFVTLIASWYTGGYYYKIHYGSKGGPRDLILNSFGWAHKVFMEAKEHIFLFLPFLALVVCVALFILDKQVETDAPLKKSLAWLIGAIAILGIIITVSGIIISGAVRVIK